jgi:hypothetical protein
MVTHATREAFSTSDYDKLSSTVGVTAVILLLLLVLARELLSLSATPGIERKLRVLDAFIVPLLLSFVVIIAARFVYVI